MHRHSSVRNPRSKGIKIKHVLQVVLSIAVCFWLIIQVKRSHDKRKEFDASDNKVSLNTRSRVSDEITKFGRKDLRPKVEETTKEIEVHQETQEQEDEHEHEHEENDDNKQDEDKIDEGEKDDGGGGDDEIDENEQEKSDVEIDREEVNIIDEDKEDTEENDEKENGVQGQIGKEVSLADHDEDGSAVHTNEAREENYNADDASSAVTHNGGTLGTENEIRNGTLIDDVGQTAKNGTSSNITTTIQEKDYESIVTSLNATSSIDSHDDGPPSSTIVDSTEAQTEAQDATVSGEQAGNSNVTTSIDGQVASNARIDEITQGSSNSTDISEDNTSDPSETEAETEGGENLETNDVTEQVTEESLDGNEVEQETVEASHLEEKEVRTDLDTLPEIETEGGNSEDTAVE